jgi:hypothetical protein
MLEFRSLQHPMRLGKRMGLQNLSQSLALSLLPLTRLMLEMSDRETAWQRPDWIIKQTRLAYLWFSSERVTLDDDAITHGWRIGLSDERSRGKYT